MDSDLKKTVGFDAVNTTFYLVAPLRNLTAENFEKVDIFTKEVSAVFEIQTQLA